MPSGKVWACHLTWTHFFSDDPLSVYQARVHLAEFFEKIHNNVHAIRHYRNAYAVVPQDKPTLFVEASMRLGHALEEDGRMKDEILSDIHHRLRTGGTGNLRAGSPTGLYQRPGTRCEVDFEASSRNALEAWSAGISS